MEGRDTQARPAARSGARAGAIGARGALAIAVLVAWGAGIALFVQRERNRSPVERLAEAALRVVPGVSWYEVTRNGQRVGFASIGVDTAPRELDVTQYLVWDAPDSALRRRTTQVDVRLSRALLLRGVSILRTSGNDTTRIDAAVESDSVVRVSRPGTADGALVRVRYRTPSFAGPVVPIVAVLRERPRPGNTATLDLLDVERGVARPMTLRVTAESLFTLADSAGWDPSRQHWRTAHQDTVRAWRFQGVGADSAFDTWIDALGQVVHARSAAGMVLHRTAYEIAFENWRQLSPGGGVTARAGGTVVASSWLAAAGAVPPEPLDSLEVRLRAGPDAAFAAMFGRRYRAGSTIRLGRAGPERMVARYRLGGSVPPPVAPGARLRPGPGIESDAPAIVSLARRLRGPETDPAAVTRRLLDWVRDSVTRDATVPPAGALETLRRRRGDCNEIARLFVALARAGGIPARPLAGLLYAGGRFYYHAWAEVRLGADVPVDPMFGELPAGAEHVRFGDAGPDLQAELMRVLGPLDLEVVRRLPRE